MTSSEENEPTMARQAARDRLLDAASRPATGDRPAIGYVCSYVPEEIILAAGFHPVRLGAKPGPTGLADACLQSFACSFARGLLDGLLSSQATGMAGLVFAHTCDSLRAVFEAWKARGAAGGFVHFLNLPARLEGPAVVAYTASEMRRLAAALRGLGGREVTADALAEAGEVLSDIRESLAVLAGVRSRRPDLLPGSDYLAMARAALSSIDRGEAAGLLRELAESYASEAGGPEGRGIMGVAGTPGAPGVSEEPNPPSSGRPRLLVSGGFLETEEPLRLIEAAGADVVADDLCLAGRRWAFDFPGETDPLDLLGATPEPGAEDDPFPALARRYLWRVSCPAKHPPERRFGKVTGLVASHRVDGVVFLLQKFCDPHAFDYPALRDILGRAGTPSLLIEVEQGGVAAGQSRTRLEAFVERLAAARLPATRQRPAGTRRPVRPQCPADGGDRR